MVDYDLGEGPTDMSDGLFHVFTLNALMDSTNTVALPYSLYPIFETGNTIDAINWTPPMTIRWDTSLFHAPYLPYDQGNFGIAIMNGIAFSQFDQGGPGFGIYNMLIDNSVTIDFLWDYLFPFPVHFNAENTIGIREHRTAETPLHIWPNPAQGVVYIGIPDIPVKELLVSDLTGRRLLHLENVTGNGPLDVSSLHPGIYLISVHTNQNHIYHGTFEKVP